MRILLTWIMGIGLPLLAFAQRPVVRQDSIQLNSLVRKSQAAAANKDYVSALQYFKQQQEVKESMLERYKQQQINALQIRYQTVKKDLEIRSKEKDISLLKAQNILTGRNIEQTRSIRKITIGVGIAVALLLLISFWQYQLKQRANLNLEHHQETIHQKNTALQDLAEQKDALLEEKELLIKEIHHRVKNNLQVVISLLNTQSAYLSDAGASAAIRQSQHRMQSISLIHQKLYQSESRALINMKEYTHELLQYLQQSFETGNRIAFELDVADIELDVLRAVPLGLILNEAITNAIKHAFPANQTGFIKIELNCVESASLRLKITDNGRGLPPEFDIDICESLGINLMKGMCRQIRGHMALGNEHGLYIRIEFPVESQPAGHRSNNEITSSHAEVNLV